MSESGPDIQRVRSEGWTGGDDAPVRKRTKLDIWWDTHFWTVMAGCTFVLAAMNTIDAVRWLHPTLPGAAMFFATAWAFHAAIYGSIFGGALLFLTLIGRIDGARMRHLSKSQRNYIIVLFVIILVISRYAGPFIVQEIFSLVGWPA
jgi:hypothetical protein